MFDWEQVNAPVDAKHFTLDGMDLPKGLVVADNKTNAKGLPLGKTGDLRPDPKLTALETEPPPEPRRWWPWAAGGAVAVVAAGLLIRRRLRR